MGRRGGIAPRERIVGRPGGPGGGWPGHGDRRPLQSWPVRPAGRDGHSRWTRGPAGSEPLRRRRDDSLAGGVAAGVAAKTGFDITLVRVVFIVASLVSGLGTAAYVVAWLLVPAAGAATTAGAADTAAGDTAGGAGTTIAHRALADRRGITLAAALGSLLVVLLLIASALGAGWLGSLSWPLVVSAAGMVLIWRNAPADEQAMLRRVTEPLRGLTGGDTRRRLGLRIALAAVLAAGGLLALLLGHASRAVLRPLGGVALVLAAIVLLLGPWWLRVARDLVVERQARVRAEERADMAARVHDSVLQTLALIQRRAGEPQKVIQLARAQERELRSWLFDGPAPGSTDGHPTTLAAGVRLIQQEVEAQHGLAVEAVIVGDCAVDDDLGALLAAAREATVNAAKWSGAPVVSVFAEVEPTRVSVFVRDRGQGFDPRAVAADRKGLAESVHARMARRGGSAVVRSAPGEGTEVSLTMPRATRGQPARA